MFRFTIRDLLWLMVVVAVVVAWRVEVYKVTQHKDVLINFWTGLVREDQERHYRKIGELQRDYGTHLEERNAKIDKLTEENLALRKQATEAPAPP